MKAKRKGRDNGIRSIDPSLRLYSLFAVLAVLSLGIVMAADGSDESSADVDFVLTYSYDSINDTATVISYADGSGALAIPATAFNPGDPGVPYDVTTIGANAFQNCAGLISVSIPDSVISIGNSAFQNCTSLTSVSIPDSVMSIGSGVFQDCTGLKVLAVPLGLTIPDYAGNVVYYDGTDVVTAHSADGISVTVDSPVPMKVVSLVDHMNADVSFTGDIYTWAFTFPSGNSVTMTFDEPLMIYNVADLKKVGTGPIWTMDECYVIANDIRFAISDGAFTPIGTELDPFTGDFYGNNCTISGIVIYTFESGRATGLFGYLGGDAKVLDLTLSGGNILAGMLPAGGIAGVTLSGSVTISNCHNGNNIISGHTSGGIVGLANALTTIDGCSNSGGIMSSTNSGNAYAGGIVGFVSGASDGVVTISNCTNTRTVSATAPDGRSGGIVGFARNMVATNCINMGGVQGDSTLDVESTTYVGGIAGRLESSSLIGCVNDSFGSVGVTTKPNSMKNDSFRYWLGGMAGDMIDGSSIEGCVNMGMVSVRVPVGTSQLFIGGLVGCMYQGTSATDCTNFYFISSVNDSVPDLFIYAGGIAGVATGTSSLGVNVTNCDSIGTSSLSTDVSITAVNVRAGGIVGYCRYATIANCDTNSNVIGKGASGFSEASVRIGGIAGYLEHSMLDTCNSSGDVSATTFNVNGISEAGGIVGRSMGVIMIDGCSNTGDVTATCASGYVYAGGVAGFLTGATSAAMSHCTNSGAVGASASSSRSGGIAGFVRDMTITDCTNSGKVQGDSTFDTGSTTYVGGIVGRLESSSMTGCINDAPGSVGIGTNDNLGSNDSFRYWIGGIAGDTIYGSSIEGCINRASISASVPLGTSYLYIGGLVGCMYQGTSAVDCGSMGSVFGGNEAVPDLFMYAGGVIGAAIGTSAAAVTIANCDSLGTSEFPVTVIATATNTRVGGVLGYGGYVTMSGCDSNSDILGSGGSESFAISDASVRSGGIAGYLENSTMSGCNASGDVSAMTLSAGGHPRAGGVVGSMVLDTSLTGCTASGDVVANAGVRSDGKAYAGGIAGLIEGTMSGCTYGDSTSLGTITSIGFVSGAGGLVGMASIGSVSGTAHADVVSQYTDIAGGMGRASVGAGFATASATVDSTGSTGSKLTTSVPHP